MCLVLVVSIVQASQCIFVCEADGLKLLDVFGSDLAFQLCCAQGTPMPQYKSRYVRDECKLNTGFQPVQSPAAVRETGWSWRSCPGCHWSDLRRPQASPLSLPSWQSNLQHAVPDGIEMTSRLPGPLVWYLDQHATRHYEHLAHIVRRQDLQHCRSFGVDL